MRPAVRSGSENSGQELRRHERIEVQLKSILMCYGGSPTGDQSALGVVWLLADGPVYGPGRRERRTAVPGGEEGHGGQPLGHRPNRGVGRQVCVLPRSRSRFSFSTSAFPSPSSIIFGAASLINGRRTWAMRRASSRSERMWLVVHGIFRRLRYANRRVMTSQFGAAHGGGVRLRSQALAPRRWAIRPLSGPPSSSTELRCW